MKNIKNPIGRKEKLKKVDNYPAIKDQLDTMDFSKPTKTQQLVYLQTRVALLQLDGLHNIEAVLNGGFLGTGEYEDDYIEQGVLDKLGDLLQIVRVKSIAPESKKPSVSFGPLDD